MDELAVHHKFFDGLARQTGSGIPPVAQKAVAARARRIESELSRKTKEREQEEWKRRVQGGKEQQSRAGAGLITMLSMPPQSVQGRFVSTGATIANGGTVGAIAPLGDSWTLHTDPEVLGMLAKMQKPRESGRYR